MKNNFTKILRGVYIHVTFVLVPQLCSCHRHTIRFYHHGVWVTFGSMY